MCELVKISFMRNDILFKNNVSPLFLLLQIQYIFIQNALDELLTCVDTEVATANMRIVIGKLSRPAEEGSSISGFQKQYDVSTTSVFSTLWRNER